VSVQARPQDYATAIFEMALEPWSQQLRQVRDALREDAALRSTLADSGASASEKLQALGQALPQGITADFRKFLGTLLEAGQFDQIDAILTEFNQLVERKPERKLAKIVSAVPLTEAEKETMRAKLAERFGSDLGYHFEVDASVIGGVYLRVGDQVIDGTVARKLAALRDRLTA
jgi:F-type H+-transporting ATPase subunit delta